MNKVIKEIDILIFWLNLKGKSLFKMIFIIFDPSNGKIGNKLKKSSDL